ncbi:hypothetical protein LTR39_001867 [Cryomyces antarcticus]|nr:hypothetical protein LTR39_001867 [Cryomyces antarcticus]
MRSPYSLVAVAGVVSTASAHGGWGNWGKEQEQHGWNVKQNPYKHVAVFSVDGMHSSDVEKYLAVRPNSNISQLLQHGYEYTDAYTAAPSDSFPGSMAQFTGATPKTTGVWYDDIWVRDYYDAGSNCTGPPGAEVQYAENIDYNSTLLWSGGIDPANLPETLANGKCQKVYPHNRLRVNTIWEVVHSKGLQTAYADKHPAYDIVRGPSGTGLSVGYFPEIQSVDNTVAATIAYDQLHVNAWLDWLDVNTPEHSEGALSAIPTLFGGNFQAVSVAQKTVGYQATAGNPFTPALLQAFDFVDASLGAVVAKLKAKNLYNSTLIVVASKHGQAAIDPKLYAKIDPTLITNLTGVAVEWQTSDDIALLFLNNSADTAKAAANLKANAAQAHIRSVIYGANLTASGFGDPTKDPAVPDIIVQPENGIIYTKSKAKIAEHGGIGDDDRKVACFVSSPGLKAQKIAARVNTTQVGPTILQALGFDAAELQGAKSEGTKALPGFY